MTHQYSFTLTCTQCQALGAYPLSTGMSICLDCTGRYAAIAQPTLEQMYSIRFGKEALQ